MPRIKLNMTVNQGVVGSSPTRGAVKKVKGLYLYSVTLFALCLQWIKPTGQKQKPQKSMNE